jgi:hypothetical protein
MKTEEQDEKEINSLMGSFKTHDPETFKPSVLKGDTLTYKPGCYMDMNGHSGETLIAQCDSYLNCDKMQCVVTDRWGFSHVDQLVKL